MTLQRQDSAKRWGGIAHAVPIPSYYEQRARVAMEQEIALLEALSAETRSYVLVFGLRPNGTLLSNIPALEAAKRWLCN